MLDRVPLAYRRYKAGLVMEAATMDLGQWLALHGPCFDAGLATPWSFHMASALAHIHGLGVVHRDIKPANVLLCFGASCHPGGYMRVVLKVSDFGDARALPREAPRKICGKRPCFVDGRAGCSLDREFGMTALVTTVYWRAPELLGNSVTADQVAGVADGEQVTQYGAKIDVWSYGATAYEMLTGRHLAASCSGAGLLRCLLEKAPEPCPGPCFDVGSLGRVPEYMTERSWDALYMAAQQGDPIQRTPWPEGREWDVVAACLRWHPRARRTMQELLRMPWLSQAAVEDQTKLAPALGGVPRKQAARESHVRDSIPASAAGACADAGRATPVPTPMHTPTLTERQQRHLNAPVLRLSDDYSQRKVTTVRGKTCRCKGHCRIFDHRKKGKCSNALLVEGTEYCRNCLCKVYGCDFAKNKSEWCHRHRRVFEAAPLPVQLAVLAADLAPLLVPCDVTDFLSIYPEIKSDLAICIICALVKEPTATRMLVERWRQLPAEYDDAALQHALQLVVRACASTPGVDATAHTCEQEQLTRQGVARFSGLACVAKDLGVLRKAECADEGADHSITLGLTHVKYAFTEDTSTTQKFLSCVRAAAAKIHPPCLDAGAQSACVDPAASAAMFDAVLQYGNCLRKLMRQLGNDIDMGTRSGSGYKVDIVVRKLCLPLHEGTPWHLVPGSRIRDISADEKENLSCLPAKWTAQEISSFACGRPDWPFLASVYMCVWKEYADTQPEAKTVLTRLCVPPPGDPTPGESELHVAARQFFEERGIPPHPSILMRDHSRTSSAGKRARPDPVPSDKEPRRARGKA